MASASRGVRGVMAAKMSHSLPHSYDADPFTGRLGASSHALRTCTHTRAVTAPAATSIDARRSSFATTREHALVIGCARLGPAVNAELACGVLANDGTQRGQVVIVIVAAVAR